MSSTKSCRNFHLTRIISILSAVATAIVSTTQLLRSKAYYYHMARRLEAQKEVFSDELKDFWSLEREIGAISQQHAPLKRFISVGTEDWMSLLDDNTPLSEISIPGTHDSAAYIGRPLCDTQSWSLSDQLRSGVRYLDIRCRPVDNYFDIHHGVCFLHQRFDDVLEVIKKFLQDHSGETIIMRISNAFRPSHDALNFEQIWNRYMQNSMYGSLFVPNLDSIPSLGDVRGRIVVVSNERGPRPNYGFQFFGGPLSNIQDVFRIYNDEAMVEKVELIFSQMERASINSEKITFNHLSGTGLPDLHFLPKSVAAITNTAVFDLIGFGDFKRQLGILIADYPGEGLIRRILLANFGNDSPNELRAKNQFQLFSATLCQEGKQSGFLDYPYYGSSLTVNVPANVDLEDNEAQSMLLTGPVDAGTRIYIGDLPGRLGKSDSTIITVLQNIPGGDNLCIGSLRNSTTEVSFVQNFQEFATSKTDLPSSFFIERPTNETAAFSTEITRDLRWTKRFCIGKSTDNLHGGPIVGIQRSQVKGCQSLVQTKTKLCRGTSSYWTNFICFHRKLRRCKEGHYVGQIRCFGAKCSRIMLHCFRTSDLCSLDPRGSTSIRKIRYGEEDFCPYGSVLVGLDCQGPACLVLTALCTILTYNGV